MEHGHLRLLNEDRQCGYYNRLGTFSESRCRYSPGLSRISVYVERRVVESRVTVADVWMPDLGVPGHYGDVGDDGDTLEPLLPHHKSRAIVECRLGAPSTARQPHDVFIMVQVVVNQLALAGRGFPDPRERLLSPLSIDTVAQFFRRHGLTPLLVGSCPLQRKAVVELDLQSTSSPAPTSPRVWPSGRSVPSLGNLMLAGVDLEQVVPNIESDRWSREYQRARELLDSATSLLESGGTFYLPRGSRPCPINS